MPDISIIVFLASLIAIMVMFVSQKRRLKRSGAWEKEFPSKELTYERFKAGTDAAKRHGMTLAHTVAIVLSKLWARLTHFISSTFHRSMRKVERELMKHEGRDGAEPRQSVFLTTIKTYKREIKKLQGRVEEELPRPRQPIEEPKQEKIDNASSDNDNGVKPE